MVTSLDRKSQLALYSHPVRGGDRCTQATSLEAC